MSYRDHQNKAITFVLHSLCRLGGLVIGTVIGLNLAMLVFPDDPGFIAGLSYSAFFAALGVSDFIVGGISMDSIDPNEYMEPLPGYRVKSSEFWTIERLYVWFGALMAGSFAGGIGLLATMAFGNLYLFPAVLLFGTAVGTLSSLGNLACRKVLAL